MSATAKIGAVLLFWLAVGLIQTFNWGSDIPKALVMLLLLLAAPLLLTLARKATPQHRPTLARMVKIALGLALALDLAYFGARIVAPHVIDIALTTLAAGQTLLHGANPYAVPIDTGPESAGFTGYKYMPVMITTYLPLGATLGQRGVLITNLVLLLACLWLMKRIACARLAPLLLAMLPLVAEQIFAKGATDLAAVLPLLGALALVERNSFWGGVCTGLSIATKLLPGVALLPALIPAERRGLYAAGVATGLLPILPFLVAGPQAFIGNIVLFNLARSADDTSWLHGMPAGVAGEVHVAFAAAALAVAVAVWRRPPPLAGRAALAAMLGIGAILAGPGAHHNYQLWWLPFYAILLSLALAPGRRVGYISGADIDAKGA
ncbi:MAG TPA: glycosyltransferase family 87 protein [Stellaceae bacterium]